jgi:hypothetical protein
MTEAEWQACQDPQAMLEFLKKKASDRKLRLFAVALGHSVRHLLADKRLKDAIDVSERFADGLAGVPEIDAAYTNASAALRLSPTIGNPENWTSTDHAAGVASDLVISPIEGPPLGRVAYRMVESALWLAEKATGENARGQMERAALFRCIFGNPFRPPKLDPSWLTWNSGTIATAAASAYEERELPSGHLDNTRLAVIADMLEEAGCTDTAFLSHLREPEAVHVRGCFALDLILGKK